MAEFSPVYQTKKPATPLDLVDPADDDDLSDIDEAPTHRQPVEPIDLSDEEGDHAGTTSRRNRDGVGKKRQKTGVAVGRTQEKKAALASRAGGSVSGRISAAQRHTRHKGSYKEEDLDDYDDEVDDAQVMNYFQQLWLVANRKHALALLCCCELCLVALLEIRTGLVLFSW